MSLKPRKEKRKESLAARNYRREQAVLRTIGKDDKTLGKKPDSIMFYLNNSGQMKFIKDIHDNLKEELYGTGLSVQSVGINDDVINYGNKKTVQVTISGLQTVVEADEIENIIHSKVTELFGTPSRIELPSIVDEGWEYNYVYER